MILEDSPENECASERQNIEQSGQQTATELMVSDWSVVSWTVTTRIRQL